MEICRQTGSDDGAGLNRRSDNVRQTIRITLVTSTAQDRRDGYIVFKAFPRMNSVRNRGRKCEQEDQHK